MFFSKQSTKGNRGEPIPEQNDDSPDSHRPSGLCPRCNKQSSFEVIGSLPLTFDGGFMMHRDGGQEPTYKERCSILICRHCSQGINVLEEQWVGENKATESKGGGTVTWRGFHWWPLPNSNLHNAVPSEISGAFNEANTAILAGCPRAGAVMARRTLEAITIDQGQSNGTLAKRLQELTNNGILLPTLADWAKEVRLIGNSGAHFDPINDVSDSDAKQLLSFISELLNYIYIMPFELANRRKKN